MKQKLKQIFEIERLNIQSKYWLEKNKIELEFRKNINDLENGKNQAETVIEIALFYLQKILNCFKIY